MLSKMRLLCNGIGFCSDSMEIGLMTLWNEHMGCIGSPGWVCYVNESENDPQLDFSCYFSIANFRNPPLEDAQYDWIFPKHCCMQRDPLRIFYETLYEQRPTSEMAEFWYVDLFTSLIIWNCNGIGNDLPLAFSCCFSYSKLKTIEHCFLIMVIGWLRPNSTHYTDL